jgi:hypothetical protein
MRRRGGAGDAQVWWEAVPCLPTKSLSVGLVQGRRAQEWWGLPATGLTPLACSAFLFGAAPPPRAQAPGRQPTATRRPLPHAPTF